MNSDLRVLDLVLSEGIVIKKSRLSPKRSIYIKGSKTLWLMWKETINNMENRKISCCGRHTPCLHGCVYEGCIIQNALHVCLTRSCRWGMHSPHTRSCRPAMFFLEFFFSSLPTFLNPSPYMALYSSHVLYISTLLHALSSKNRLLFTPFL